MLTDIKGRQIPIGSIVSLRLVVTGEIPDTDPVNCLAKLEKPWPGTPDDLRYSLASQYIELVSAPPAAASNGGASANAPGPAPAAPQPQQAWPPSTVPAPPAAPRVPR